MTNPIRPFSLAIFIDWFCSNGCLVFCFCSFCCLWLFGVVVGGLEPKLTNHDYSNKMQIFVYLNMAMKKNILFSFLEFCFYFWWYTKQTKTHQHNQNSLNHCSSCISCPIDLLRHILHARIVCFLFGFDSVKTELECNQTKTSWIIAPIAFPVLWTYYDTFYMLRLFVFSLVLIP